MKPHFLRKEKLVLLDNINSTYHRSIIRCPNRELSSYHQSTLSSSTLNPSNHIQSSYQLTHNHSAQDLSTSSLLIITSSCLGPLSTNSLNPLLRKNLDTLRSLGSSLILPMESLPHIVDRPVRNVPTAMYHFQKHTRLRREQATHAGAGRIPRTIT